MEFNNSKNFFENKNFQKCNENNLELNSSKNNYYNKIIDVKPVKINSKLKNFIQNNNQANKANNQKIKEKDKKLENIISCDKYQIINDLYCDDNINTNKIEIKYDINNINRINTNPDNNEKNSDKEIKNNDTETEERINHIYPNMRSQSNNIASSNNNLRETEGTIYNNDGDSGNLSLLEKKEIASDNNESSSKFLNFNLISDKNLLSEVLDFTKLSKLYSNGKTLNSQKNNDYKFKTEISNPVKNKNINRLITENLVSYISQIKSNTKNNIVQKKAFYKKDNSNEKNYENNIISYEIKNNLSNIISCNINDNSNDYKLGKIKYKEYNKNDFLIDNKNKSINISKNQKYIQMTELLDKVPDINLRNQILNLFLSYDSRFNSTAQSKNSLNTKDFKKLLINDNDKKIIINFKNENLMISEAEKINILSSDKKKNKKYNESNVIQIKKKGLKFDDNKFIYHKKKEFKKNNLNIIKNIETDSNSKNKTKKNAKNSYIINPKDIFLWRVKNSKSSKTERKNNLNIKWPINKEKSSSKNSINYNQSNSKNKINKTSINYSYHKNQQSISSKNDDISQKLINCKSFLTKNTNSAKKKLMKDYNSSRINNKFDIHNCNLYLRKKINEYNINKSKQFVSKNEMNEKIDFFDDTPKNNINPNNSFNNKEKNKKRKLSGKIHSIDISLAIKNNKFKNITDNTLTQRINNYYKNNAKASRNGCKTKITKITCNTVRDKSIKENCNEEFNYKLNKKHESPIHYIYMNKMKIDKFNNVSSQLLNIKNLEYEIYLDKIKNLKEIIVNLNLMKNTSIYGLISKIKIIKVFCSINKNFFTIYENYKKNKKLEEMQIGLIDKISVIKTYNNCYGFILIINFNQNYFDRSIGFVVNKEIILNELIDVIVKIIPNIGVTYIHI